MQVKNKDNKLVWPEAHDFVISKRRYKSDLIPKDLLVTRYFSEHQQVLSQLQAELEATSSQMAELEEEHRAEGAAFTDLEKVNDKEVKAQIKKLAQDTDALDDVAVLKQWLTLSDKESQLKKTVKELEADLDQKAFDQYAKLTDADIQQLVVQDKWLATMQGSLQAELDRVSQTLTHRIRELAERYATPLPALADEVEALSAKVAEHLKRMGVSLK